MPPLPQSLTTKGAQTSEHLLATALKLFQEKGYHATTMRDIAAAAECSLGLAYRYYPSKDDFVLTLYRRMAHQSAADIATLPADTIAMRFRIMLQQKLAQVHPYRSLFQSILGTALTPQTAIGVLGSPSADVRTQAHDTFHQVVTGATNAPDTQQTRELGTLLYGVHFGVLFFWLSDPTPDQWATAELIACTEQLLRLTRPLLVLPPCATLLTRLAGAVGAVVHPTIEPATQTDEKSP